MEKILSLILPLILLPIFLRLIATPMRWFWKLLVNGFCGLICLLLVNSISGITGLLLPVNPVTVIVTGFLGLPGIVVLILVQLFLS